MEPTIVLTQDQIDFYHREGYLALDAITTPKEVEWLREIYDRLFETRAGREEGNQFDLAGADEEGKPAALPQILNPSRYAPELKEGLYRVNALAIARQLLGPEAIAMGEHAIFKPAHVGAPTPWHQDEAYWNPQMEYNSFSLWMPLQPATLENGCMQFVPRSHRREVLPHHCIDHDPRIHGLELDPETGTESGVVLSGVDAATVVACPLPPGGATVHHNRTLHYAGPNRSDIPRRAYILAFGLPPTPRAEPRTFPWNDQKQTAREQRAREAREAGKL
jgi:ectoine hydroxylase-related dioxygenase (phytanoyl-CoA dioxygenase family)